MNKILFIADFSNEWQFDCLRNLLQYDFSSKVTICLSGHNIPDLNAVTDENDRIVSGNLSSSIYMYYLATADLILVLDNNVNFTMYKTRDQYVLRCVNKNEKEFNRFGEYDKLIELTAPSCVTDILDDISFGSKNDYMVVYYSETELKREKTGLIYFLEKIKTEKGDLILVNCSGDDSLCMPDYSSYRIDITKDNKVAKAVIEQFDGIVVYLNNQIESLFKYSCKERSLLFEPNKELYSCDCTLFCLSENTDELIANIFSPGFVANREYKRLLTRQYDLNNYRNERISVIICRYNTPLDLLYRAVYSALECGHYNTEVIVVDDGSSDNIEQAIKEEFAAYSERLRYVYKENEGLGLSRNFGMRIASGDYVFFLDSDDTLEKGSLSYLITHLCFFGLNFVSGKRVLCDSKGVPINESMRNLYDDTYRVYYNDSFNKSFDDKMVNNKLYRLKTLLDKNQWFKKGLYEDVLFMSELYKKTKEWHTLNIRAHNWYQYGENSSISSSVSYNNFKEKYEKLEESWNNTPEHSKYYRFYFIICFDFLRYYQGYNNLSVDDQNRFFDDLCRFVQSKSYYINRACLDSHNRRIVDCLLNSDRESFDNIVKDMYIEDADEAPHDNYIILTHYHLFVSIVRALRSDRPSRLFIYYDYSRFASKLIERIRSLNIFTDVIVFNNVNVVEMFSALEKCPDDSSSIIPTYLYPYYSRIFNKCDQIADDMYIFSDSLPYWYYIHRHFDHIIKLEDAYNSFEREYRGFNLFGNWASIDKYVGKEYPLIHYKSDKIGKVIISSNIDGLPREIAEKIEVEDTVLIANDVMSELKPIINVLYNEKIRDIDSSTILVLTQPLYLYNYCSKKQQKELYQIICSRYDKKNVIIKPHPADMINYHSLGYKVIEKDFPIEIYNYSGIEISKVISFASSSMETIKFAKTIESIYSLKDLDYNAIKPFILNYLKNNKTVNDQMRSAGKPRSTFGKVKKKIRRFLK